MREGGDPWSLPGLLAWLSQAEALLDQGLAVAAADPARPQGMTEALFARMMHSPASCPARPGQSPASVLAEAFGTAPALDALLQPALTQEVAVVGFAGLRDGDLGPWSTFLDRFFAGRAKGLPGPAILIPDAPPGLRCPPAAHLPPWQSSLRRGDRVIWAEEHLPRSRTDLVAELAVALAAGICGPRLDLARELVQAGLADLADPLAWLARRPEQPLAGSEDCPLAMLRAGRDELLRRRVWHAHLVALFPALEEVRLGLIDRYRPRLGVDEHMRLLGVESAEELEFGALHHQLYRVLARAELDRVALFRRVRNDLAHRKMAAPADVLQWLSGGMAGMQGTGGG